MKTQELADQFNAAMVSLEGSITAISSMLTPIA